MSWELFMRLAHRYVRTVGSSIRKGRSGFMRYDLRQELYALVAPVPICAGVPGDRHPYSDPVLCFPLLRDWTCPISP